MTDASPFNTAALLTMMPSTISANPTHASLGVAKRHLSRVDEQKYSTAISNEIIQKISMLTPCMVSNW